MAMLWTARHWWAQGARFMFNCYCHWALLVIRQPGTPPAILHSREGVTQGDSTSMIRYGVALLPLADQLKEEEKKVLLWFVTDKGLDRGYFPEPYKSIHICNSPADLEATKAAFKAEGLKLNYYDGGSMGAGSEDASGICPPLSSDRLCWAGHEPPA
eukprot:14562526-Ditylum_brightwellii.AAC.1